MSESRLIGRSAHLDDFQQHIYHCLSGQPRVLLVEGLAGIGKTRLLKTVGAMAGQQGFEVYSGTCNETMTEPYAPFAGLLHQLEQTQVLDGGDVTLLRRFLGATSSSHLRSSPDEGKHNQVQLRFALSRGIMTLAQQHPLLLIVEDLHTADRPSLEMFAYLTFALAEQRTAPLLLVGSYRPVTSDTALSRQVLSPLSAESIVQNLDLLGLGEAQTREFLERLGVARPTQQFVRTIQDLTHGIPLFIEQAVHHAVSTGVLYDRGGDLAVRQRAIQTWQLPSTVSDAIAARIASLPPHCLEFLTLAALLGDSFSVEHLVILGQNDLVTIRHLLEDGMTHEVLIEEQGHFRFAHGLVRQAFAMRLDPETRRQRHLRIAQGLEDRYRVHLGPHVFAIAHHLIEAGDLVDSRTLITYARLAGDQAQAQFAWSESVRYYEAALHVAEVLEGVALEELAALYFDAGSGHYSHQDVEPALDRFEKAAATYRVLGDTVGLANSLMYLVRLSFMYEIVPMGTLPPDINELEAALETLGDNNLSLRGHILALLAQTYRFARQPERATQLANAALSTGRRAEDDRVCAQAANSLGLAHLSDLQVADAINSWQSALSAARATGDRILQMIGLTNLPHAFNLQGALEEGEVVARVGADAATITQYWSEHSKALSHLASIAVAQGNFTAAEKYAQQTLVMVARSRYPWGGYRALGALACASTARGLWHEANEALDIIIEPGRVFASPSPIIQTFVRVFRQLILGYSGTILSESVTSLHDDLMAVATHDTYSLAPLCAMIELSELTLMPALTQRPAEMLAVALERGVAFSSGWGFLIPRSLGVAAIMQEDWPQAEAHLQHAITAASFANAMPDLARAYLDYARLIYFNPNTEDMTPAATYLRQARAIFHERDMLPYARLAFNYTEGLFGPQMPFENLATLVRRDTL